MKPILLSQNPTLTGAILAVISMAAGATAVIAADFGKPAWVFVPLLLWLLTFGSPTLLACLLLASIWGSMSPFYGLLPFAVVTAALAIPAQVGAIRLLTSIQRSAP